jgi:hypothetical protein
MIGAALAAPQPSDRPDSHSGRSDMSVACADRGMASGYGASGGAGGYSTGTPASRERAPAMGRAL